MGAWEEKVKAAAEKAATELLERFAAYPAELRNAPRRQSPVGSTHFVRAEDVMKQLQWQMRRDDVRRIFAGVLGVDA